MILLLLYSGATHASEPSWLADARSGNYDNAVQSSLENRPNSLARLIEVARKANLHEQPQWLALVHYKKNWTGGYASQIDAPYFFQAPGGKHDPKAELEATLAAFFSEVAKKPMRLTAYCRFVARRTWLTKEIPLLDRLVPKQQCHEYERYKNFLDADTLTIIFPTSHPNSPSSAFGHTLIRIDRNDQPDNSRLLNMSLNFAADVPPSVSSISYAFKGITGGFQGRYRLLPYHIKLREYAQIENRDTWEYALKLNQQQVDFVLSHAYEMLIAWYDYYFFTENCSYHLLSLLDVVFAEEPLTEGFNSWTIPVDILKLLRKRNLVDDGRFVASSIKKLQARQAKLNAEENQLALTAFNEGIEGVDARLSSMAPQSQAKILDLIFEYARYDRLNNDPGAVTMSDKERETLSHRSRLQVATSDPVVPPEDSAPELGHDTARVAFRYTSNHYSSNSLDIEFRPAYHDFKDPSRSFGSRAAIEFMRITLAQPLDDEADHDEAYLKHIRLIGIESLEPRGTFFKPVSWRTRLDWERPDVGGPHQFTFSVGAGGSWQSRPTVPLSYALLNLDLVESPAATNRLSLQVGASAGAIWEPISGFRLGLDVQFKEPLRSDTGIHSGLTSANYWVSKSLGRSWSAVLNGHYRKARSSQSTSSWSGEVRYYF